MSQTCRRQFAATPDRGWSRADKAEQRITPPNAPRHQSPAMIAVYLLRLLPVAAALTGWLMTTLLSDAVAIAVGASAALIAALCQWRLETWRSNRRALTIRRVLLAADENDVPFASSSAAELSDTPLTALFGLARLRLFMPGCRKGEACRLLLPARSAAMLARRAVPTSSLRSLPRKGALWALALSGETPAAVLSGALPILSGLKRAAETVGAAETIGAGAAAVVSLGMLPAAAVLALLCALGKAAYTLVTCGRFAAETSGEAVILRRGLWRRRICRLPIAAVAATEVRRTLFCLPHGLAGCRVLSSDGTARLMLPPCREREIHIALSPVVPLGASVCRVSPEHEGPRYAAGWWTSLALLPVAAARLCDALPALREPLLTAALCAGVLLAWRAAAASVGSNQAGLALFVGAVEITAPRGLSVCTLRAPRGSVGIIRITRSPFARRAGACTVSVYVRGGSRSPRCIRLPFDRALAVCRRMIGGQGAETTDGREQEK